MIYLKDYKFNLIFKYWLLLLIALIFLIIVVGGLTRLTDSGLSITEWELLSGILPPLNNEKWMFYFSLYKKIPQYNLINQNITLDEFKIIYYWEYAHRILARIIGLVFIIPFFYFIVKKKLTTYCILRLSVIFILILTQGLVGWYMVMSGLVDNISVSHYRLAIHLTLAFIIISTIYWNFLNFNTKVNVNFFNNNIIFLPIKIFIILLFVQIVFGAFVSGLDAGKIYQTWPLMNNSYFPDDNIFSISNFFDFSNKSIIQFYHRNIAYLILFFFLYVGFTVRRINWKFLARYYKIVFIFILIQLILGISVLLSNLNISFASLHQISSVFLVISSLNLYHKSLTQIPS